MLYQVTKIDFLDSIMTLGFGEERNQELLEVSLVFTLQSLLLYLHSLVRIVPTVLFFPSS